MQATFQACARCRQPGRPVSDEIPDPIPHLDKTAATEFIGRPPSGTRDSRATGFRGYEAVAAVKAAIARATKQLGADAPDAWDYTSSVFISVVAEVIRLHPDAILYSVHSFNPFGHGPFYNDGQIGMVVRILLPYVGGDEIVVELDLTGTTHEVNLGTNAWVGYFYSQKNAFIDVLRATGEREVKRMVPLRAYLHAYAEQLMQDPYHPGHIAWE